MIKIDCLVQDHITSNESTKAYKASVNNISNKNKHRAANEACSDTYICEWKASIGGASSFSSFQKAYSQPAAMPAYW
jgi:hypothetical protein